MKRYMFHCCVIMISVVFFLPAAARHAEAELSIVVGTGPFGSVREAASGEERVDWWDGDPADDRACTECFAATELSRFLPACTGLEEGGIRFASPESVPPDGHKR